MSLWRARAGLAAGGMAWLAAARLLGTTTVGTLPRLVERTATVDDVLAALASLLGLGMLLWLAVVFAATTLSLALPRGSTARAAAQRLGCVLAPVVARRALALAIAAALASSAAPARAATDRAPSVAFVTVADTDPGGSRAAYGAMAAVTVPRLADGNLLDPSWAPVVAHPAAPDERLDPSWGGPARARPAQLTDDLIVVRRGDTLWDLAARQLGPDATDAEIARAWPLWFTANRSVIGPDPDRLTPGQRLRPPDPAPGGKQ